LSPSSMERMSKTVRSDCSCIADNVPDGREQFSAGQPRFRLAPRAIWRRDRP
jgi:hypothetical protein